ncbi:hypothetical protein ACQ4LE_004015 [Meloidogyne hapla]
MLMPCTNLRLLYKDCKRKRGELRHMFKKSRTELAAERLTKYQAQTMRASSTSTTDTISSEPCSSSSLIDADQGKIAYRYNIEIITSINPSNGWNLTKGASVRLNHRDVAELVGIAVNKACLLSPPNTYVYDGSSIYSTAELHKFDPISISYSEVSESIQQMFKKKTTFHVIIKPCQLENRVSDLNQYEGNTSTTQEDRSLHTFFEFDIAQKTLQRL